MFLFRRLFKQFLITVLIGFIIRRLMQSSNERARRVGFQANRLVGGMVGLDETGRRVPRRRRAARTAGSAFVGGALSYFFDPVQGHDRRARAKALATDRLGKMSEATEALPPARTVPDAEQVRT